MMNIFKRTSTRNSNAQMIFMRTFATHKDLKIAFIGLGAMGLPMATNLVTRNQGIVGAFDLNQDFVASAAKKGCKPLHSLEEVAAMQADIIFSALPTSEIGKKVAEALTTSPHGVKSGSIWVDFTSGDPAEAKEISSLMKQHNAEYLDSGVAGGPAGAKNCTLSMMVGGSEDALQQVTPVLNSLAAPGKITHLGPSGAGFAMKSINNAILAVNICALGEGLAVLKKQGVSMDKALKAINTSSGRTLVSEERFHTHVLTRKFDFGFKTGLMLKDTNIAMSQLDAADMSASTLRSANAYYKQADAELGSDSEHMRVVKFSEVEAGVEIS